MNNIVTFVILIKDREIERDIFEPIVQRLFKKVVTWDQVPNEGDRIILAGQENGWNVPVRSRWFDVVTGEIMIEFRDVVDSQNEGLAEMLLEAGWEEQ